MKKTLPIATILALLIILAGCELYTERAIVSKLPDKLIYIAGQDTELDLTGGEVTFHMSDGSVQVLDMSEYGGGSNARISYEIDFNAPGIYIVYLNNYNGNGDAFAIMVVNEEYIDSLKEYMDNNILKSQ